MNSGLDSTLTGSTNYADGFRWRCHRLLNLSPVGTMVVGAIFSGWSRVITNREAVLDLQPSVARSATLGTGNYFVRTQP